MGASCGCFTPKEEVRSVRSSTDSKQPDLLAKEKKVIKVSQTIKILNQVARIRSSPILLNKNEVIFLESWNSNDGIKYRYSIYDMNQDKIISAQTVTNDDDEKKSMYNEENMQIDSFNTEYAYNPNNNSIYFLITKQIEKQFEKKVEESRDIIEKDLTTTTKKFTKTIHEAVSFVVQDIIALDLNSNKIRNLNKRITNKEDSYSKIVFHNNKLYIFGAESITNNDDMSSSDYFNTLPYAKRIRKFGQYARVVTTKQNGEDHIYLLGGLTKYGIKGLRMAPSIVPNDLISICKCDENGIAEWTDFSINSQKQSAKLTIYFTVYPVHSFGFINYKNEYLFQFGGVQFKKEKINEIDGIYVLLLIEPPTHLSEVGIKKHFWHELTVRLAKPGRYYSIYSPQNDSETVHLFVADGTHYTVNISDLLDVLGKGVPKGAYKLTSWTEQGKTVMPTKSKSIPNIGPKADTEIDEMLEELGEVYDDNYKGVMEQNDIATYQNLIDKQDELKECIKNTEHLATIIHKAKELNK